MRHPFPDSLAGCVRLATLVAFVLALATEPLLAQMGRIQGSVKDENGKPLRGATILAENPNAAPSSVTTTTDDKGRWTLLGLRIGSWRFTASLAGYESATSMGRVEGIGATRPLEFRLMRGIGAITPGVLGGVDLRVLQSDIDRADALFAEAKYAEAVAAYRAILVKAPALTSLKLRIGQAQRLQRKYDDALETFGAIAAQDLAAADATREIGLTYLEKGDLERADAVLTKAAGVPEAGPRTLYAAGEVSLARGRSGVAAEWFRKAAEADPLWPKPVLQLGLIAVNGGDPASAVTYLERVIAMDAASPEATQARTILLQLPK
jgi:tetratricopeptide (TPR) repeat protein